PSHGDVTPSGQDRYSEEAAANEVNAWLQPHGIPTDGARPPAERGGTWDFCSRRCCCRRDRLVARKYLKRADCSSPSRIRSPVKSSAVSSPKPTGVGGADRSES